MAVCNGHELFVREKRNNDVLLEFEKERLCLLKNVLESSVLLSISFELAKKLFNS